MSNHPLTGEVSNSKLAAVFDTAAAAREAAAGLVQALAPTLLQALFGVAAGALLLALVLLGQKGWARVRA